MEREHINTSEILRQWELELLKNTDRRDEVLYQLEREAQSKVAVIMEGPPIYLWPPSGPRFYSMQWKSKPFMKGWGFVNTFADRIPAHKSHQDFLIDDLSYKPKYAQEQHIKNRYYHLSISSPGMKKSALFQENSERTRVFLQSSLADQLDTRHSSKLDAEFNARKILDQVATGRGNPLLYAGNADKLMLLIVCPDSPEVRAEQLNMISELYRILRADNDFQKISRKASSAAITETYRHVWLDDDGKVTGLTRPIFQGGHFSFING